MAQSKRINRMRILCETNNVYVIESDDKEVTFMVTKDFENADSNTPILSMFVAGQLESFTKNALVDDVLNFIREYQANVKVTDEKMTEQKFWAKFTAMVNEHLTDLTMKKAKSALRCGAIDLESFDDNFILPKVVLSAIGEEIKYQFKPFHNKDIKLRNNLEKMI